MSVAFFTERFLAQANPARAIHEKAYQKSPRRFFGASIPVVRAACKEFQRANPSLSREPLLALCGELMQSEYHEHLSAAAGLLERYAARLSPADLPRLIDWIRLAAGWAINDWISIKPLGQLLLRTPDAQARLLAWSKDPDFWVRRASLLGQLDALKAGGDFAFFASLAAPLLVEREFFIRKAIGWVLREVSKQRPALVAAFLQQHRPSLSGLTLREASKYL